MDNYIQWNLPNWITVFLMVSIMTLLVGAVSQGVRKYKGSV